MLKINEIGVDKFFLKSIMKIKKVLSENEE